jgi:hypothetical protein
MYMNASLLESSRQFLAVRGVSPLFLNLFFVRLSFSFRMIMGGLSSSFSGLPFFNARKHVKSSFCMVIFLCSAIVCISAWRSSPFLYGTFVIVSSTAGFCFGACGLMVYRGGDCICGLVGGKVVNKGVGWVCCISERERATDRARERESKKERERERERREREREKERKINRYIYIYRERERQREEI